MSAACGRGGRTYNIQEPSTITIGDLELTLLAGGTVEAPANQERGNALVMRVDIGVDPVYDMWISTAVAHTLVSGILRFDKPVMATFGKIRISSVSRISGPSIV